MLTRPLFRSSTIRFAAGILAALGCSVGPLAGNAGATNKVYETTRYESVVEPIGNWTTYAADGTPLAKDPNCPSFPGVSRSSKVWVAAYAIGGPIHASIRMEFHTTYSVPIATAKLAIQQTAGRQPTCAELNTYKGSSAVDALAASACAANAIGRPARWCTLMSLTTRPVSVSLHLNEQCRTPAYGGRWGLTSYDSWHNVNAQLYDQKGPLGINVPVYLDDFDWIAGVTNFDQNTGQPTFGDQWIGYGNVQSAAVSETGVEWYDTMARSLHLDPVAHPVSAHQAVQNAVNNHTIVKGVDAQVSFHNMIQSACNATPKVRDMVDPGGANSFAGMGEDMNNWVQKETGKSLCQHLQADPKTAVFAPIGCHYGVLLSFVKLIDNNTCMNQPDNPIAVAFGTDLGCTKRSHLVAFFLKLKEVMGG